MDTEAPKSEKSYWIGTKDRFSIIKEEYTKINDTVTITPVEGKELFLKIELSDSYGIGLKTSVLYKDTTKILVVRPIYQESQWLYIEFIHSPLVIKNETDTFNYFIVISFNSYSEKFYRIEGIDKYGNEIYLDIKIIPKFQFSNVTSTTGDNIACIMLSLIVIVSIVKYRRIKMCLKS